MKKMLLICLLLLTGCSGNTKSFHTERIFSDKNSSSAYDDGYVMGKIGAKTEDNPYGLFNDTLRRCWNQGYYDGIKNK